MYQLNTKKDEGKLVKGGNVKRLIVWKVWVLVVNKAGCLGEIDICNKVPFSFCSDVVIGHFLIALEGTIVNALCIVSFNNIIIKWNNTQSIHYYTNNFSIVGFHSMHKKGAKTKSYVHNTQWNK